MMNDPQIKQFINSQININRAHAQQINMLKNQVKQLTTARNYLANQNNLLHERTLTVSQASALLLQLLMELLQTDKDNSQQQADKIRKIMGQFRELNERYDVPLGQ